MTGTETRISRPLTGRFRGPALPPPKDARCGTDTLRILGVAREIPGVPIQYRLGNPEMHMIPQLPSDKADFATLVQGPQYIYVDKTRLLAEIFSPFALHTHVFLARPRRFGKTLLLSTVEALFQGRRDLFQDTWIGQEDRWDWEGRTCPVLRLDLGLLRDLHDREELRTTLRGLVDDQAKRRNLALPPGTPALTLHRLLERMAAATGRRIVVLVDEYDTAITENLHRPQALPKILDILRAFYGALKSSSDAGLVEYTLVTGIARLARAGLFSGANHLKDLSYRSTVNSLLGFTSAELRTPLVAAQVAQSARHLDCAPAALYAALEREYNGYRFAEGAETVFNPYTLADCLEELAQPDAAIHWSLERLPQSWAATGTPTMLLRGLQGHRVQALPALEGQAARPWMQVTFDVRKPPVVALLWQAGYLTLDAAVPPALTFPNREVQATFTDSLGAWLAETAPTWLAESGLSLPHIAAQLQNALQRQDADAVRNVIATGMETVPKALHRFGNAQTRPYEPFYQALLHVLCLSLGLPLTAERETGLGRVDLALELPERICLLELKVDQSPAAGLRQAFVKDYPAAYGLQALPVTVWGLQFDSAALTVRACQSWDLGRFDPGAARWDREPYPLSLAELRRDFSDVERAAYVQRTSIQPASDRPPTPRESRCKIH